MYALLSFQFKLNLIFNWFTPEPNRALLGSSSKNNISNSRQFRNPQYEM